MRETYKDIDLTFTPHPLSGDVAAKVNGEAIKRALRNLFAWRKWDFPFNPEKHNYILASLFDNHTHLVRNELEDKLAWLIRSYEPRVELDSITAQSNDAETGYNITVKYRIAAIGTDDSFTILFERIR